MSSPSLHALAAVAFRVGMFVALVIAMRLFWRDGEVLVSIWWLVNAVILDRWATEHARKAGLEP